MRLVGGNHDNEGRVEILYNGIWGTVCGDDQWTNEDAKVICRQLGHSVETAQAIANTNSSNHEPRFGQGAGPILLAGVGCLGSELNMSMCDHDGWGSSDECTHEMDAGVICEGM